MGIMTKNTHHNLFQREDHQPSVDKRQDRKKQQLTKKADCFFEALAQTYPEMNDKLWVTWPHEAITFQTENKCFSAKETNSFLN